MIIHYYKKKYETMGELVIRFRKERGIHGKVKVTFAGRLDPLAYGEVILLTHADVYLKEKFTKKSKEYIVTLLFGLKTDTDDLLGVYNSESNIGIDLLEKNATLNLIETLLEFKGEHEWEFHPFSSKTIKGKALFQISKEGGLLTLPVRTMNIYDIHTVNPYVIKGKEVLENIQKAVHSVQGDFRQDLIRASLVSKRESIIESDFFCLSMTMEVGSGTYIRMFARKLGELLDMQVVVYDLWRSKILTETENIWNKNY